MRGSGVVAAGAVLALAMAAWWGLRAQEQRQDGGVVLAAAERPQMPWQSRLPMPTAAASQAREWVQSEADKAWCKLSVPIPASMPTGEEALNEIKRAVEASDAYRLHEAARARLKSEWLTRLRTRGDERSLAVADLMEDSEAAQRHLVELARNTKDPAVYAWALRTCGEEFDCGLSVERWVQLDPGNMSPWFVALNLARGREDEQAEREAVYQIGQSRREDDYGGALLRVRLSLSQARASGLQMTIEHELARPSTFAGTHSGGPLSVAVFCSTDPERSNRSRQAICLAAAEALWNRADGLSGLQVASSIAMRNGSGDEAPWKARTVEANRLTEMKVERLKRLVAASAATPNLCTGELADFEEWQSISTIGELAWLRGLSKKELR